jgi:hypothetical protein
VSPRFPRRGSGFQGLLGGSGFAPPGLTSVATASEKASCDKPRLRQAIAAMRANEIAEGLDISLDRRRKFLAFLEVSEEMIEGALAQRMDCPREALEALARNLVFHGRSPVWGFRRLSLQCWLRRLFSERAAQAKSENRQEAVRHAPSGGFLLFQTVSRMGLRR